MGMLIASLQVLYQCRFLWQIGDGGVPWARVGLVLGSVCLTNLAGYLLGFGSGRRPLGLGDHLFGASVITPADKTRYHSDGSRRNPHGDHPDETHDNPADGYSGDGARPKPPHKDHVDDIENVHQGMSYSRWKREMPDAPRKTAFGEVPFDGAHHLLLMYS